MLTADGGAARPASPPAPWPRRVTIDALAPGGREGPGSTDGWFRTRPRDPMVSLPTLQREAADRMDALFRTR